MAVTLINRITGSTNNLVYLVTTDNIATATGAGYLTAQAATIQALNDGEWQWESNDLIILSASDGVLLASINAAFTTLTGYIASQLVAEVNLSAAQIAAMYGAPILAVAAPVAGTINIVKEAYLSVDFVSAQYASGGAIALQYKNTVHGAGTLATDTISAATLNGVTADEVLLFDPVPTGILLANATAQGIYISNQTGAFTTGDSPVKLYVYYNNIAV